MVEKARGDGEAGGGPVVIDLDAIPMENFVDITNEETGEITRYFEVAVNLSHFKPRKMFIIRGES
jgi:hypothetical protein